MAQAPTPGGDKTNSSRFLRLRLRDQTLEVNLGISLQEAFVVRAATGGMSLEALCNSFGKDTFGVLWWLARRQNGEPRLSWDAFCGQWDPDLIDADYDLDNVDINDEDEKDDSPEGEGHA